MRRLHDIPQERAEKSFFETLMDIPIPQWLTDYRYDPRIAYGSANGRAWHPQWEPLWQPQWSPTVDDFLPYFHTLTVALP